MVTRLFEERSRTWLRTLDDHWTSNFEHKNRRLAFVGYLQEKGYNRYGGYSLRLVMMIITMMVITVTMMMPVFRKKRGAIDMLAGPVIRNHDDYNEVDDYIQ